MAPANPQFRGMVDAVRADTIWLKLRTLGEPLNDMKNENPKSGYNRFLLLVAGLGGLLFGVDVGIISGALPYLEATSGLNAGQLSFIVAAVLLGGVISTLFAGLLADLFRAQTDDDLQRPVVRGQRAGHRTVAKLRCVDFRTAAAGHQRRTHWRRRAAVSRRMSFRHGPRQGHRHFPMAAYARHRRGGNHRFLFQRSGRGSCQTW